MIERDVSESLYDFDEGELVILLDFVEETQRVVMVGGLRGGSVVEFVLHLDLPLDNEFVVVYVNQMQAGQQGSRTHRTVYIVDAVLDVPLDLLQVVRVCVFRDDRGHSDCVHLK